MSTRYPLVLVPGMLGFVRLVLYPYWFGIIKALRRGGATVVAVQVSPLNSTEVRGEQLLARIEEILRESGAQKVNLFGHSQGALTARYAAAKRPDLVASVTSVAGPNHGSELADYLEKHYPANSAKGRLLEALLRLIGWVMALLDTGSRAETAGGYPRFPPIADHGGRRIIQSTLSTRAAGSLGRAGAGRGQRCALLLLVRDAATGQDRSWRQSF